MQGIDKYPLRINIDNCLHDQLNNVNRILDPLWNLRDYIAAQSPLVTLIEDMHDAL